jgi:outer membrane murein-binding lipoprotein Lpp
MGGKPTRRGNVVYLCVAFLIFLGPLACTLGQTGARITDVTGEEARGHLALGRKLFHEGNFNNALHENENVITLAGENIPVSESLFYIGLIHAHPANPARDDGKSMIAFNKLVRDHPESPLADQAKAIMGLIQENDRLRQRVEKLNGTVDRLTSEVRKSTGEVERLTSDAGRLNANLDRLTNEMGRLNRLIDELKRVDIDVEQKRREKGK